MQLFILFFILYLLPIYDCYLNSFFYVQNKKNIALKSSLNNNNMSLNNKKLYDDYSKFLNNKKTITYVDLNNLNKNTTNSVKKQLLDNNNVIIVYNSNTKTILRNIKDILKY